MAKFSKEEKIMAVKRYLAGEDSFKGIANSIGADTGDLRTWLKRFEYYGEEAFEKAYTIYSASDKLDVLNYMHEHRTSTRETAAVFNIKDPSTIRRWITLYESGGVDALQTKKKGRPSMKKKEAKKATPIEGSLEALQAEVEYLRAENAYLKKLKALVQEREVSKRKNKRK